MSLSNSGLDVAVDGRELLRSTKPIELRHFERRGDELSAKIHAEDPATLTVSLGAGDVTLAVDGANTVCPATAVQIPAGESSVCITPVQCAT